MKKTTMKVLKVIGIFTLILALFLLLTCAKCPLADAVTSNLNNYQASVK